MRLDAVEARIVGSLVEKQLTTPQQYPLTLNSLTLACNQTSNRDPVVSFSEQAVEAALNGLKAKGMVRFVLPSHGRSVVRYRHVLDEKLALDQRQMALVAVLLLRGPQTVGELRARTERMAGFESVDEVESDLEGLTRWEEPLVVRLTRRPGQKEERWAQLLADEPTAADVAQSRTVGAHSWSGGAYSWSGDPPGEDASPPTRATPPGSSEVPHVEGLRGELAALKDQMAILADGLATLQRDMTRIRDELGMD